MVAISSPDTAKVRAFSANPADGDHAAGERALRLMFDLGAYFEHNPSTLIHEYDGQPDEPAGRPG